jgi:hypothetical protein
MKKILQICILLILSFSSIAQLPNYVSTDSLIGWWSFTGNTNDSSGNGNNCTPYNSPILSPDRFGNPNSCYLLNGTNQWIQTDTNIFQTSNPHSISIWWKTTDSTKTNQTFFSTNPYTLENFAFHYSTTTTPPYDISYSIGNGIAGSWTIVWEDTAQVPTPPTNGNWHNVVYTKDSMFTWRFYFDANLIGIYTSTVNTGTQMANLRFGAENAGVPTGGANFEGYLDDIGLWDRALNQCEISKLFFARNSLITNAISNDTVSSGGYATYTITDTGGVATYQWQRNSGSGFVSLSNTAPYSGVTTKTLTISPAADSLNGYQYRCIRNGGVCIDTSNTALLVLTTTGIAELSKEGVNMSPNPAYSTLNINAHGMIKNVEILNVIGKRVFYQHYNSNEISVDVSTLEQGFYFIKFNDELVQRFIKE